MPYKNIKLENVLFEKEDRVGIITLNRPQRLNALSEGLQNELIALIEALENDDDIGAVIITGASRTDGRPCFTTGADTKEMQEKGASSSELLLGTLEEGVLRTLASIGESRDKWHFWWNLIQQFPKPLIAAIDGLCMAGGVGLALCCDIRIVSETAMISDPRIKNLGVFGGSGFQTHFPRAVGAAKAKEMMWTGDPIGGKEACQLGFAQQVYPPNELMEKAKEMAAKIAAMPALPLRLSKMVINASLSQSVYESLRFSALNEALLRLMASEDAAKARQAFVDKGKKEA